MKTHKDLTGQVFNMLTVESYAGKNEKGKHTWNTRCICGITKVVASAYLVHNQVKSCGRCSKVASKTKDLTNQTFGTLTALEMVGYNDERRAMWRCSCSCGGTRIAIGHNLINGDCKYCDDCSPKTSDDIEGQIFGMITVGKRINDGEDSARWNYTCSCGVSKTARYSAIIHGNVNSCGCQNYINMDHSGKVFGRLTVIRKEVKTLWGSWKYLCRCECQNECLVETTHLTSGKTVSCGCYNKEIVSTRAKTLVREKNPRWRGGIAIDYDNRLTKEYAQWRRLVKERDGCKCVLCGSTTDVQAHHINSFIDNQDKIYLLENGVSLCKTHHIQFHVEYGYGDNTPEQFQEFANAVLDSSLE